MNLPRPRRNIRAKAIQKRQTILDTTVKIIARNRSADFTLRDVADDMEIYAGSIYYYFDSKDALVKEVILACFDEFQSRLTAFVASFPEDGASLERLKEAIKGSVRASAALDDYLVAYNILLEYARSFMEAEIRKRKNEIKEFWGTLIADAQRDGAVSKGVDAELLQFLILGAAQYVSVWYSSNDRRSPEQIAAAYTDLILNGILDGHALAV